MHKKRVLVPACVYILYPWSSENGRVKLLYCADQKKKQLQDVYAVM
jgi:hypothetical protein